MDHDDILRIVGDIYRTVREPDLWEPILEEVASMLGFEMVTLSFSPADRHQMEVLYFAADEHTMREYQEHYGAVSPYAEPALALSDGRSIGPGIAVLPRRELLATEYFHDWMRPAGLHDTMSVIEKTDERGLTALTGGTPTGQLVTDRQITVMRMLMPHVFSALDLRRQFDRLEHRIEVSREGLVRADFGCIIVDDHGQVQWMNPLARDIVELGEALEIEDGELRAAVPSCRGRLRDAIRGAIGADRDAPGAPTPIFRLARADGSAALEVLISPVEPRRTLEFGELRGAMVLLADPTHVSATFADRLVELYGLTPAEAEVAQWLVSGSSPGEIAEIFDRSIHTIRTHLKRIFAKTNTSSQPELVGLLQRGLSRLR
jgi:DNA-binding CsgD family transcriptional regulator